MKEENKTELDFSNENEILCSPKKSEFLQLLLVKRNRNLNKEIEIRLVY